MVPPVTSTRKYPPRVATYTWPESSPVIADAAAGRGSALARPLAGITVTTAASVSPLPRITKDADAVSKTTDLAWPAIGRTSPAGGRVTAGDTAASAGAMVGGGASSERDVHPVTTQASMSSTPHHAS